MQPLLSGRLTQGMVLQCVRCTVQCIRLSRRPFSLTSASSHSCNVRRCIVCECTVTRGAEALALLHAYMQQAGVTWLVSLYSCTNQSRHRTRHVCLASPCPCTCTYKRDVTVFSAFEVQTALHKRVATMNLATSIHTRQQSSHTIGMGCDAVRNFSVGERERLHYMY